MEINEDVVIIGAGIAGLATAVALKRVGIPCLVIERSDKLRTTGSALTLFPNAWLALDALAVSHKLTSVYNPTFKVKVTDVSTGDVQELSFKENNGPRSVHRNALLEVLAEELPADSIRFSSNFTSIQEEKKLGGDPIVILHLEDGTIIKSKVLIGCDGVHSRVAKWLGLSEPVHSGRSAVRGLAIYPQDHGFKHEVMQFVDVGKRAGLVPLNDNQLYWFLTYKQDKIWTNDSEDIQNEVINKYAKDFPSIFLDAVQNADVSNLSWAPLLLRKPWDLIFGNLRKGNITTIGDAMHPMTPDLGQGGGAALEDAVVLGRLIGNSFIKNKGRIVSKEMGGVLDAFVQERKWRVAILIAGAYVSGWIQQSGSSWWEKFLRDAIFYGFLYPKIFKIIRSYNCGILPTLSNKLD